jgi:hypothetical protein
VEDFNSGVYYPTASFFKNVVIKFNFGPDFKYAPKDVPFRGVSSLLVLKILNEFNSFYIRRFLNR